LVSRRHCELREANGQLRVRDLGSLNGTFVGRERVDEAVLWPGDLLTVGTVTFRAIYDTSDVLAPEPSATPAVDRRDTVVPDTETLRVDSPANPASDTQVGPHIIPRTTMPHQTPPR
jgi:pSer/pThr/pTyr-binding forkhead associated (FHA) protein